ncbi:sialin-like [Coccinella septempunctata]|uniref:sialin-like n=1 Tax=Coccinella septempunctata TaxID=41139 RepID=UPI001D060D81|nr:sialin-like [Coccinella septempunctata]
MRDDPVINSPVSVKGIGVRHGQILLQFLFYIIVFGIEISLSSTLSAMLVTDKKFENTPISTVSQMMCSYMFGFVITELFGAVLCKRYGFKWPMVLLMIIISAVTLNLPTLTDEYGAHGIIACRAVQGLCIGLLFSMPAEVISRWVPIKERTMLGTTVYASGLLGEALALYAGGYLSGTRLNWTFVYTQLGYLAIIWVVLMAIFGADSPEQYQRKISGSELDYIVHNRGNVTIKKKMRIPWRKILTSMPFWAIVVAQIGAGWILFVLTVNIPQYMAYNYMVPMTQNTIVVVNLITWVLSFSIAGIAQLLINEGRTTIEQSRKLFNTLGSCIPAFFFILLGLVTQGNQYAGMAIWVTISVTSVGTICGSKLNSNDITTNFAPVVYGIATWISLVFNMITLTILTMNYNLDDWNVILIFSALVAILTNLFYVKFGSGEEQEWNLYEDLEDEEIDLSKSTSRASVDEGKYLLYVRKQ